jgi:hypothetical protein
LRGSRFEANQAKDLVSQTPSQPVSWIWWYESMIPVTLKALGRPAPGKNTEPIQKKKERKKKRVRVVGQVVC